MLPYVRILNSKEFWSYSPAKLAFFLKSRLLFNMYCLCMFVIKKFAYLKGHISQKMEGIITRNLCYIIFDMKKNILQDFHICISVT